MPSPFDSPPQTLTPLQRKLFWIAVLAVAATRWFAMATSPWDWDEVQFMAAVREYDVGKHHPHPAGFPLYILLANAVQYFGYSDFRSLQVVAFLAACSLFPLTFALARVLGFSFRTAMLAALFFAFFPNIWYFGGTVFSDITGVAINLAAMTVLVWSTGERQAKGLHPTFLLGCALTGAALAVRPHSGFILLAPLLYATWHQRHAWGRIIAGALITASIAIASYAGAAMASESVAVFVDRVRYFQTWVQQTDSIANPGRTPLSELAMSFFVWPMGAGRLSMIVGALSLLALFLGRKHKGVWLTFATFAPYMLFAWLMLDPVGFRRYSTAYVAIYALLAVFALERLTSRLGRFAAVAHVLAVVLLTARYVMWAYPAIAQVRSSIAPTHEASTFAQAMASKGERIWVDDSMNPWASYYLADREVVRVNTPAELPFDAPAGAYFFTEGLVSEEGALVFARRRGRVAEIHPERHFEASVVPVATVWRFGEGWGDHEGHADRNWRWMAGNSVTLIPGTPGKARLRLVAGPPKEIKPEVEVRVNGAVVDRFRLDRRVSKDWFVDSAAVNRLELRTSATVNPKKTGTGTDDRELGLQLFEYGWRSSP